jgi:hypothetical protein
VGQAAPKLLRWVGACGKGLGRSSPRRCVEFFTNVPPDSWSVPGWPQWTEGSPGVIVLEKGELVAIEVVVTMRRDAG